MITAKKKALRNKYLTISLFAGFFAKKTTPFFVCKEKNLNKEVRRNNRKIWFGLVD